MFILFQIPKRNTNSLSLVQYIRKERKHSSITYVTHQRMSLLYRLTVRKISRSQNCLTVLLTTLDSCICITLLSFLDILTRSLVRIMYNRFAGQKTFIRRMPISRHLAFFIFYSSKLPTLQKCSIKLFVQWPTVVEDKIKIQL